MNSRYTISMPTVLITGANGLVGQKTAAALSRNPRFKTIATSFSPARFAFPGVLFGALDITAAPQIEAAFKKHKPEILLNCAAFTDVNRAEQEKDACRLINVTAVEHLAKACHKYGTRLIHLSTDFIFDGKAGPYKETDSPNPLSHYGKTKLEAEEIVGGSKIPWAIVRTCLVYGITGIMPRSNILLWVKKNLDEKKTIRVVLDQIRTPTLAEDLADGLISLIEKGADGLYHIAGSEPMSIYEMACRIADFWKFDRALVKPAATFELNEPAARPPVTGLIIEKAKKDLNYRPRALSEGLKLIDAQLKELNK